MAEVESTHSNGKHSLEDSGDAPVKAKLLKTENGSKAANGNGVAKTAEDNVDAGEKSENETTGGADESNDVLAQTQSEVSKHNEESNTNDTNGDVVTSGRGGRKVKAGQENSTSAYGDEEEDEDVDDEGDDGEDSDEDDDDEDGEDGHDGDEDDGEDDDEEGEGPDGDEDDEEDDDEDGDE